MLWTKAELTNLYHSQGKTLAEIGDSKGVTREYVRQCMQFFGIPRIKHRKRKPYRLRYDSLDNYLRNSKASLRSQLTTIKRRYIDSSKLLCSECGSSQHILIHHIRYRSNSLEDIQFLCASCHTLKHRGKVSLAKQFDLFNDFERGIPYKELMQRYGISQTATYLIIRKIRNGWHTQRG